MRSKITVIIPVYNVEKYLSKCINSVIKQTYKNIEIILVDDGSLDSSGVICDKYANYDSRIKVIHKNNGGLSSARNAGIEAATGEFLSFIDSDDWIEEDFLEKLMDAMIAESADISVCGVFITNGKKVKKYKYIECRKIYSRGEAIKNILLCGSIDVSAANKLYKRDIFSSIRYPEGENNEDAAIIMDIFKLVNKIVQIPYVGYYYYQRAGSISMAPKIEDYYSQLMHAKDNQQKCFLISDEFEKYTNYYIFIQLVSILKRMLLRNQYIKFKNDYKYFFNELKIYEKKIEYGMLSKKKKILVKIVKFMGIWI